MPKYYCDYCDTFLTHDSPSVRKTHNGGRKHKENVRMFYQKWMEDQAQKLVDATTRAFVGGQRPTIGIAQPRVPVLHGRPMVPAMPLRPPVGFPGVPQFPSAAPFVPPVGVAGPMSMRPGATAPFRPPGTGMPGLF